ncbi:hypothetical protein ACFXG4_03800 [Nocardia sp. NPDC059246]|uniref:hypothetical protein n=1 Tax=unclassified Nocardia TaxID=2637762 RepID=UPI00367C032F
MTPTEAFWDGIWDLVAKYDIALTNNSPKPGLPHIADFGHDVLALLALVPADETR